MILGIVGHAADKFTPQTEAQARAAIRGCIKFFGATKVVSGRCPLGGIDIYAIEEAKKLGIDVEEFPPAVEKWEGTAAFPGYHQRNMQIAEASDMVISFCLNRFPPDFKGRKFTFCYHHRDEENWHKAHPHIKSGGCWTAAYARKIGKLGRTIVLE